MRAQTALSVVYRHRGEDVTRAERWEGWRVGNLRPTGETRAEPAGEPVGGTHRSATNAISYESVLGDNSSLIRFVAVDQRLLRQ